MTQYVLKAGNDLSYDEATANANQQANFDTAVNPVFKNTETQQSSVVCYEIRNSLDNVPNNAANTSGQSGVTRTNDGLNLLNRAYPNTTTVADYLDNLETTDGYRIQCYNVNDSTGQQLSATLITDTDYFVCVFADNYKKHHFAKITQITSDEATGDSFTFTPAYNGSIPKGTKFTIWKGPEAADLGVVAVGYGLQGSGDAADARHDVQTICAKPNFFFYDEDWNKENSRLLTKGQLNHDTKYQLFRSIAYGSLTQTHATTCFVTEQEYGFRAIDYGKYSMNATLVDNLRTADTPTAASTPQGYEKYGGTSIAAFNYDFADWAACFPNIQRDAGNFIKSAGAGFVGPKRYIHYTKSLDKNNVVPRLIESNVFNSVTKTGTYAEARLIDPHRIMGKKIKEFDEYRVKHTIAEGRIEFEKTMVLPGKWTNVGNNYIKVSGLESGHYLDALLFDDTTTTYEEIRIGDYHYKLGGHGLVYQDSDGNLAQNFNISGHRLKSAATYTTTTTIPVAFSESTAYRKAWSKVTKTLMVNFPIDSVLNADRSELLINGETSGILIGGKIVSGVDTNVRNLELVLTGGNFAGMTFKIEGGEKHNGFVTFQDSDDTFIDPSMQLYQKLSLEYPNVLDYFQGSYSINKLLFKGSVESIEEYVESGQHKFFLSGRSDVSKLLGPAVNKDYTFSNDWVYSTILPFNRLTLTSNYPAAAINLGSTTFTYTGSDNFEAGDYLWLHHGAGVIQGRVSFIGKIQSINTSTNTITLEEGSQLHETSTASNRRFYYLRGSGQIALAKAAASNGSTSSKTTSLEGAITKGLVFNSGKQISSTGADSTKLLNSSSSDDARARGYYIQNVNQILESGDSSVTYTGSFVEEPFMLKLGEAGTSLTQSSIETVSSMSEYAVVDYNSGEGKLIFSMAPICPAVLARVDNNAADSRLLNLTAATTVDGAQAIGYTGAINVDTTDPLTTVYISGDEPIPKYLYNSSGQVLGRVIKARWRNGTTGYTLATGAFLKGEILLDRALPVALADEEVLYVAKTGSTDGEISHGLYFLNTQGLYNGGILHGVNSSLSSAAKPITFSSNDTDPSTAQGIVHNYHPPVFRYMDLQKGSLSYKGHKLLDGLRKSHPNTSNVNGYAQGLAFCTNGDNFLTLNDSLFAGHTSHDGDLRENQLLPQARGMQPAHGSNFEDYHIYSDAALRPQMRALAQYDNTGDGGPFLLSESGTNDLKGFRDNAISHMRDNLEIIDPNMLRWFIFAPGDLHPESMTRMNHLGYTTRDFTDFNLILKSKGSREVVDIGSVDNEHTNYHGITESEVLVDNDYQEVSISSASITPDQMRRVGIMRLKELTMDWHFNPVDTETNIDFTKGIEAFTPYRFLSLEKPSFYDGITSNPIVTATSSYATNGSKTIALTSNTNFKNGSSGDLIFNANDRVYANDGTFIGEVDSANANGDEITLKAEANLVDGLRYCSANTGQDGILYKMKYEGSISWDDGISLHGKGGENATTSVGSTGTLPTSESNYKSIYEKVLSNYQGVVFNGEYPNRRATGGYYHILMTMLNYSYFGVNPLSKGSAGIQFPPMFGTVVDNDSTIDMAEASDLGAEVSSSGRALLTVDNLAETKFKVGDELYVTSPTSNKPEFLGIIYALDSSANTVELTAPNAAPTSSSGQPIYLGYKSLLSRSHIFFDALVEQKGYTGSRVINGINTDIDDSANLGVAAISMTTGHSANQGLIPTSASPPYSFTFTTGSSGGSNAAATYDLTRAISEIKFNGTGSSSVNYAPSSGSTLAYIDIHEIDLTQSSPYKYTYRVYFDDGSGDAAPSAPSPGTRASVSVSAFDTGRDVAQDVFTQLQLAIQDPVAQNKGIMLELHGDTIKVTNVVGGAVGDSTNELGHIFASSTLPSGFGEITYLLSGGNIISTSITNSGTGYTSAPAINNLTGTYKSHSSHTVATVSHIAHVGTRVYSGMKAVVIDRHNIENQLEYKAEKGSAVDLGLCYQLEKSRANTYSPSTFIVNTEINLPNSTVIKLPFSEKNISGSVFNNYNVVEGGAVEAIADGVNFVIKPLLHLDKGSSVGAVTVFSNDHIPSGENKGAVLKFNVSPNATEGNLWLRYAPNLTGCYLVSSDGIQYGSSTANTADVTDYEGTWSVGTAADARKAATASTEGLYPNRIHYVVSHTVTTSGSTQYHELIVDNWNTTNESLIFRVMQPAETCFWENTPNEIDLYKMSSKYTKMTNSNDLYGSIGQWNVWEDGPVSGIKNRYGMNEGIQSMYVFVDMDPKTGSTHIVPRDYTDVIGSAKKFTSDKSYNCFLTDGISNAKKNVSFTTGTNSCTAKFAGAGLLRNIQNTMDIKMNGIVSIGEIFTLTTEDSLNTLEGVETASIASTVSICSEAEDIINDLFKENNIPHATKDTSDYPYFTGINFIGSDMYNAVNYLSSLKDKKITIGKDIILKKNNNALDFTNLRIANDSSDIKVIEIKKNQSMYDVYNEITVYGKRNKSTKRNRKSINDIGRKTFEKYDTDLSSQSEVDREAERLLMIHSKVNNRITIKTTNRGIELLQPGRILTVDLPQEGILADYFMVLEIRTNAIGVVELELGQYDKGLSDRLAELLVQNKRVTSVLRGDRYKAPAQSVDFFDTVKIRSLRLVGRQTSKTGSPFTIGFNYPIDVEPTGGTDDDSGTASYPMGFNTALGSVDITTIVDEDLT